jgi:hypothetical protein
VIPAHNRVLFRAGVELLEAVFFAMLLQLVIPWLLKIEYVQLLLENVTEGLQNAQKGPGTVRLIDEL